MIQNLFGLANDGKTNRRGVPRLLPLALFAREFRAEGEFIRPPRLVQRVLFAVLAPMARRAATQRSTRSTLGPDGEASAAPLDSAGCRILRAS